ncbi:unnamed protein product [Cyclocybe aegerita]|uniref:Tc1-like transposase DDE domain-containing protein n=1 Tax=Cyclocybe aegerita TaxID=1973307 RepID=A0A8S0W3D4_CYCAE|nr:unnamed protein product [Cyclocybe aegerita]
MAEGVKIPPALRQTIVRMSAVFKPEEIHVFTTVSKRQQSRILKLWKETGQIVPDPPATPRPCGRPRNLSAEDVFFLHGCVNRTCDVYLDKLQESLGIMCQSHASIPTIWRTLRRAGYRMKKLSQNAVKRSARKCARYILKIATKYQSNQLVFVDKSAADCRTTYRGYAWAIRGRRAVQKAFFVRGRRYSMLPAMSEEGILSFDIIEGSFNKRKFGRFIDGLLDQMNPFPMPNSVIIMDNCWIHKDPDALERIEARGMRYLFLPPYSPDFNPIELGFSSIKSYV